MEEKEQDDLPKAPLWIVIVCYLVGITLGSGIIIYETVFGVARLQVLGLGAFLIVLPLGVTKNPLDVLRGMLGGGGK